MAESPYYEKVSFSSIPLTDNYRCTVNLEHCTGTTMHDLRDAMAIYMPGVNALLHTLERRLQSAAPNPADTAPTEETPVRSWEDVDQQLQNQRALIERQAQKIADLRSALSDRDRLLTFFPPPNVEAARLALATIIAYAGRGEVVRIPTDFAAPLRDLYTALERACVEKPKQESARDGV